MVKVTYKGESRDIPAQYLKGLKGKDRDKQIKSIFEGTIRPKTKAPHGARLPEKRSSHVIKFEKKYNKKITDEDFIHKNIITRTGQKKIMDKAMGAYFSGGSRPNQTPSSWAYARLASVITGGGARKVDKTIWDKYKVNKNKK
tara:strand:- start:547 stop:975 length:429 start_codon:yes stop_codon:yes gene_type:complete